MGSVTNFNLSFNPLSDVKYIFCSSLSLSVDALDTVLFFVRLIWSCVYALTFIQKCTVVTVKMQTTKIARHT